MKMLFLFSFIFPLTNVLAQQTVCQKGLDAFKVTMHPELTKACVKCHSAGGLPQHSNLDPEIAYPIAKKSVNFNDLENSTLMKKVKEKHWIKYDPSSVGMPEELARTKLKEWYDAGEKDCPPSYNYISQATTLNTDLPASQTQFKRLRFDLGSISNSLKGATFEVEAQIFAQTENGKTYRLRNPRIHAAYPLLVDGIQPMINGEVSGQENLFLNVNATLSAATLPVIENEPVPAMNLSLSHLFMTSKGSGDQKLAIGFRKIQKVSKPIECQMMPNFEESVMFEINQNNCTSCHGDQTLVASKVFPLHGSNSELCKQVLMRTDKTYPSMSSFLAYPVKGIHEHPVLEYAEAKALKEAFATWIKAEIKKDDFKKIK